MFCFFILLVVIIGFLCFFWICVDVGNSVDGDGWIDGKEGSDVIDGIVL